MPLCWPPPSSDIQFLRGLALQFRCAPLCIWAWGGSFWLWCHSSLGNAFSLGLHDSPSGSEGLRELAPLTWAPAFAVFSPPPESSVWGLISGCFQQGITSVYLHSHHFSPVGLPITGLVKRNVRNITAPLLEAWIPCRSLGRYMRNSREDFSWKWLNFPILSDIWGLNSSLADASS